MINAEPLKVDLLGGLRVTVDQQQRLSPSVLPCVDLEIPHHTASDVYIMVFKVGKGGGTGHCVYTTWEVDPVRQRRRGDKRENTSNRLTHLLLSSRSHRDMGCGLLSLMWALLMQNELTEHKTDRAKMQGTRCWFLSRRMVD